MNILSSHWYLQLRLKVLELRTFFSRSHGFTLMEIVIVIGITGILASAGYASYVATQKNSRDGKRKADLETIRQALEMYKSENGSYPGETWCDSSIGADASNDCTCFASGTCTVQLDWSTSSTFVSSIQPSYLMDIPKDPINNATNYYYYEPVCNQVANVCGQSFDCTGSGACCAYQIGAYLENNSSWYTVCNP